MRRNTLIVPWSVVLSIATCLFAAQACASGTGQLRGLVKRILATSTPESTAVLVTSDRALLRDLIALSSHGITVIPVALPNASPIPAEVGQLFRETSAATTNYTDVWVVSSNMDPRASRRAGAVAEMASRLSRTRVLRDSVKTSQGTVTFSRWVDVPGGAARRAETRRDLARADSIMAQGGTKPIPITAPFTRSELAVDADTMSFYMAHLADTSFYSIGGCSEVEILMWSASEKLGRMGPGVVPVLVPRAADPDPFVRERVQDALMYATQDERILARTGGDYLKFYDQPSRDPRDIIEAWWRKFGHFWVPADSTR